MTERVNFEDLDAHAIDVLRSRNTNVTLAPWQLRSIIDHVIDLREEVARLEKELRHRKAMTEPEQTFE